MRNVDVIIPTHNCIYISEAIESVLHQTHRYTHITIVDDGSTDDTKNIIAEFVDTFPGRISYHYQKQKGPAAARNTGIQKSKNEYIAFLDADDRWLPKKIEKQLALFNLNSEIGFVYCDNYFMDQDGKIINNYVRKVKLLEGNILLDFFMDFFLITSAIILKRSCLKQSGIFNENLEVGEDFEFFLRLAKYFNAGVVKEKLFKRRVWKGSLSKQDFEKNKIVDIETLKKFISGHPTFYKKHRRVIKKRISDMYFKFGYALRKHGNKVKALIKIVSSLKYHVRANVAKELVVCLLPNWIIKILKKGNLK
jgi:glycosyltransferase involved in cell wall biosynthesis